MARLVVVIRCLSPSDGDDEDGHCWTRIVGHFHSDEDAWRGVETMWDMMVLAGDYVTVEVVKTIAFRKCK